MSLSILTQQNNSGHRAGSNVLLTTSNVGDESDFGRPKSPLVSYIGAAPQFCGQRSLVASKSSIAFRWILIFATNEEPAFAQTATRKATLHSAFDLLRSQLESCLAPG